MSAEGFLIRRACVERLPEQYDMPYIVLHRHDCMLDNQGNAWRGNLDMMQKVVLERLVTERNKPR